MRIAFTCAIGSLLCIGPWGSVMADSPFFECITTAVHDISEAGEIVTDTAHLKSQVGSKFRVHKTSGAIQGGYFINNESSKEIRVINSPTENTYYVISVSNGPYVSVGYLYIGNHRNGPQKPFTYTSSGAYVYSGFCH
jgi:hypothetical protein